MRRRHACVHAHVFLDVLRSMCVFGVHDCMWVFVSLCVCTCICICACACVNVARAWAHVCFHACVFCMYAHMRAWVPCVSASVGVLTHVGGCARACFWSVCACVGEVPLGALGVPVSELQSRHLQFRGLRGHSYARSHNNGNNKVRSIISALQQAFLLNTSEFLKPGSLRHNSQIVNSYFLGVPSCKP